MTSFPRKHNDYCLLREGEKKNNNFVLLSLSDTIMESGNN